MFRSLLLTAALLLFTTSLAYAGEQQASPVPSSLPSYKATPGTTSSDSDTFKQPNLVSFGIADSDFDKSEKLRQSADFRAEYRWGMSLLPMITPWFRQFDNYVQFHPFAGVEVGSLGQLYGLGGWATDFYLGRHVVVTWSEGAGLYYGGASVRLGSFLEFRSMGEIGWVFDNEMRLTAQVSHVSNAKITEWNPGSEYAGIYLHVPSSMIFGK